MLRVLCREWVDGHGHQGGHGACGCTTGNLYCCFENPDEMIIGSTAYCMTKVKDDFMSKAPTDPGELMNFIDEVPYRTAEKHGIFIRACVCLSGFEDEYFLRSRLGVLKRAVSLLMSNHKNDNSAEGN